MTRDEEINQRAEHNMLDVLEHGPRLAYGRSTWIVAKDTARDLVLVGGLGGMGVGQMWFTASDDHKADPTYADAPQAESGYRFGVDWPDLRGGI